MKRRILIAAAIVLTICAFPLHAFALERGDIISEAAVVMDAVTGQVLFDKNMDKMMFPASTTKIMTGLLAAEKCAMDEVAAVTESAIDIDEWNSSNIALTPGEELPVDSLMYALMLPSANDAANVLAEHVAGSQRDFAQLMTERARRAGAVSTHFVNAHGLHDPGHYTTAGDLALITREAIKNPVFMQYFGAGQHTIPPTNLQPLERPFTNYQYMLVRTTRFFDPAVVGGKVGYTREARHTMSTVATRAGRTLICVTLNSPSRDDKFLDTEKLFDFGFGEFTEITVPKERFPGFTAQILSGGAEAGTVDFTSAGDFTALLHNSVDPSAVEVSYSREGPFEQGEDIAASAVFSVKSDNPAIPSHLGAVPLEPDASFYAKAASATLNFRNDFSDDTPTRRWWFVPLISVCAVALVFCALLAVRRYSLYKRRKRRRERLSRLQRGRGELYAGPRVIVRK